MRAGSLTIQTFEGSTSRGNVETIDQLNAKFGLPGQIRFESGQGGLTRIAVTATGGEAELYLHGAHVTHFRPASSATPVLFLSNQSRFSAGKAIRGGVPICFPWFGPLEGHDTAPAHGFARTSEWTVLSTTANGDGTVSVRLRLEGSAADSKIWPHAFRATYTVTVGSDLELAFKVEHVAGEPFLFEEALHTYLTVGDVKTVSLTGLASTEYIDKVQAGKHVTEGAEPIRITGETDRVYLETDAACVVTDPATRRAVQVRKKHSGSTVVWNPWVAKSKALADLGDDEWPGFLCVESANIGPSAVILRAGESHAMEVTISVSEPV
jgi:glucose-6-phosphate 1-epimerase